MGLFLRACLGRSSARAARVAHVAALVLSAGLYERKVPVADKGFFIERLPREGKVTFLALVKEKELRKKRDGGFYLHLLPGDRTGELDAKVASSMRRSGTSRKRPPHCFSETRS